MSKNKILIVEDEDTLREMLQYNFETEGYDVITSADGRTAIALARSETPDLVILDVMLPEVDGFEVCRTLRQEMTTPILMLTAKEEEIDKVLGLELGADDYMTKPFSMRELLARVRAMLRRTEMMRPDIKQPEKDSSVTMRAGDIEIDFERCRVSKGGAPVDVTPKEFELLACLMKSRGRVCSRDYLLQEIWGYDFEGDTRTVDVHIRWLRQKIESNPQKPEYLITVRGTGCKLGG